MWASGVSDGSVLWALRIHLRRLCCSRRAVEQLSTLGGLQKIPEGTQEGALQRDTIQEVKVLTQAASAGHEVAAADIVAQESTQLHRRLWTVGEPVERLLDDISDIWAGAVIAAVQIAGSYDISYVDDGSVELGVEGCELRPRKARLDMPAEVWESVGGCLCECRDLCTFEQIAVASCHAMQQNVNYWWCTAFHERFGRCGARCRFDRVGGAFGAKAGTTTVKQCFTDSTLGQTALDRTPWKTRFVEHQRLLDSAHRVSENVDKHLPGDKAYSVSGQKVSHADVNVSNIGFFFDPRLGRMVREG